MPLFSIELFLHVIIFTVAPFCLCKAPAVTAVHRAHIRAVSCSGAYRFHRRSIFCYFSTSLNVGSLKRKSRYMRRILFWSSAISKKYVHKLNISAGQEYSSLTSRGFRVLAWQ
jgi:hypothetical protein